MPENPLKRYAETIGNKPLLDIGLRGLTAGGLMYMLAGPGVKLITRTGALGNPKLKELADKFSQPGGGFKTSAGRLAAFAAGMGVLSGLYNHADVSHGWKGFKDSLTQGNYWGGYEEPEIFKAGSLTGSDFMKPTIDTFPSVSVVSSDPWLIPEEKKRVSNLILASSEGRSRFSQMDMTSSALKAGIDFGSAYLIGRGIGGVLGLPKPISKRLSVAGGLANAVRTSGLLG